MISLLIYIISSSLAEIIMNETFQSISNQETFNIKLNNLSLQQGNIIYIKLHQLDPNGFTTLEVCMNKYFLKASRVLIREYAICQLDEASIKYMQHKSDQIVRILINDDVEKHLNPNFKALHFDNQTYFIIMNNTVANHSFQLIVENINRNVCYQPCKGKDTNCHENIFGFGECWCQKVDLGQNNYYIESGIDCSILRFTDDSSFSISEYGTLGVMLLICGICGCCGQLFLIWAGLRLLVRALQFSALLIASFSFWCKQKGQKAKAQDQNIDNEKNETWENIAKFFPSAAAQITQLTLVKLTKCSHIFHQDCYNYWICYHKNCAKCKLPLLQSKLDADKTNNSFNQSLNIGQTNLIT